MVATFRQIRLPFSVAIICSICLLSGCHVVGIPSYRMDEPPGTVVGGSPAACDPACPPTVLPPLPGWLSGWRHKEKLPEPAPYPRFHPLPTRPMFEPQQNVPTAGLGTETQYGHWPQTGASADNAAGGNGYVVTTQL